MSWKLQIHTFVFIVETPNSKVFKLFLRGPTTVACGSTCYLVLRDAPSSQTQLPNLATTIAASGGSSANPSTGPGSRAGIAAGESTLGSRRRWKATALELRSRYARVPYAEDRHQARSRVIRPRLAQLAYFLRESLRNWSQSTRSYYFPFYWGFHFALLRTLLLRELAAI